MNSLIETLAQNAEYAHWVFFFLLMLAGLNFPISEDLVVLSGAIIAATVVPENTYKIFIFIFLGCYLSDWVAYWIGRGLMPWLKNRRWLTKMVNHRRIAKVSKFYNKYGVLTLLFGRFIPFGVRNFLFMTAGMGRMNFLKFIIVDGVACLLSNTIWFTIAYSLAENYETVTTYMKQTNLVLFAIFIVCLLTIVSFKLYKRVKNSKKLSVDD